MKPEMKMECEKIQNLLLDGEAATALLQEHLTSCPACAEFAASLNELNRIEAALPKMDAPLDVVSATVMSVRSKQDKNISVATRVKSVRSPLSIAALVLGVLLTLALSGSHLAPVLMLAFFLIAVFKTLQSQYRLGGTFATLAMLVFVTRVSISSFSTRVAHKAVIDSRDVGGMGGGIMYNDTRIANSRETILSYLGFGNSESGINDDELAGIPSAQTAPAMKAENSQLAMNLRHNEAAAVSKPETYQDVVTAMKEDLSAGNREGYRKDIKEINQLPEEDRSRVAEIFKKQLDRLADVQQAGGNTAPAGLSDWGGSQQMQGNGDSTSDSNALTSPLTTMRNQNIAEGLVNAMNKAKNPPVEQYSLRVQPLNAEKEKITSSAANAPAQAAEDGPVISRFWSARAAVTGLNFKSAKGYWSNTYIPGDPLLRALVAKLASSDHSLLSRYAGKPLELDSSSRPALQHLDVPEGAALGVGLTGDFKAASGPARMLLQVSLKAAEQKSALRPPMHVAIVLDGSNGLNQDLTRAALNSFDRVRVEGDKFSVVVAGRGGLNIPLGAYRYGTVQDLLQKLTAATAGNQQALSLTDALQTAITQIKNGEDPQAPFGTSMVVVLSSAHPNSNGFELEKTAYRSAVDGIPVSTIALGANADYETLGSIALAGQGERQQILNAQDAENTIKEELTAVSRVVARALRINIKLAPGVKLVDVLGSKNLNEEAAQRLRVAEQSLDKRMQQKFGIESDRGKDDDGIQVIVPAFYGGDAHVILLDVVAPGPGPVAEVQVKYKDLLEHKNGTAQAAFALANGEHAANDHDPIVLKNLLSYQLADAFQLAVDAVDRGQNEKAVEVLNQHRALLNGLQSSVKALAGDADIARDVSMLDQYVTLLQSSATRDPAAKESLLRSMELAGKQKISPPVTN